MKAKFTRSPRKIDAVNFQWPSLHTNEIYFVISFQYIVSSSIDWFSVQEKIIVLNQFSASQFTKLFPINTNMLRFINAFQCSTFVFWQKIQSHSLFVDFSFSAKSIWDHRYNWNPIYKKVFQFPKWIFHFVCA